MKSYLFTNLQVGLRNAFSFGSEAVKQTLMTPQTATVLRRCRFLIQTLERPHVHLPTLSPPCLHQPQRRDLVQARL